jgi:hypothetical protein
MIGLDCNVLNGQSCQDLLKVRLTSLLASRILSAFDSV